MGKSLKLLSCVLILFSMAVSASAFNSQPVEEKKSPKLRWKNNRIKIALSSSLFKLHPNIKPDSDIAGAITNSLKTWEDAADLEFETISSDKQSVSPNGNFGDGVSLISIAQTSENLLMFAKDSEDVSARTRVFFNKKGFITEADIILNPYRQFSTDGSIGTFDLESILTHEIGHLLGLEHSSVFSATMHENTGKNGIFNLSAFVSRTLASTDISAVRAIYGAKPDADGDETECCGAIKGRITGENPKQIVNYSVWAEESWSGRVAAQVSSESDGSFLIEGLSEGSYRVFAQNTSGAKEIYAVEELGAAEISAEKIVNLTKKAENKSSSFDLHYVGFNGQLTELSVPINGGKSYMIYIGGKNLDPKTVKIKFNTRFLTVTPRSLIAHDYGEDLSVLSFEVKVNSKIPAGEYNISVVSKNGSARQIIGGLTIEDFANPWNSNTLLEN